MLFRSNDTATIEIYTQRDTLSLHDALPISGGELIARHITGGALPDYAPAFRVDRYQDPDYATLLDSWGDGGQL